MQRPLVQIEERKIKIVDRFESLPEYALNVKMAGPENGPALVFLHGMGGESNNFKNQFEHFASQGYRVLAIDGNGSGQSSFRKIKIPKKRKGAPAHRLYEEHSHDVLAVLDKLGIEKAVFVGHSDGATNAQTIAKLDPQRVQAQVLVGGVTRYGGMDIAMNRAMALFGRKDKEFPRIVRDNVAKMYFHSKTALKSYIAQNKMPTVMRMRNWAESFEPFETEMPIVQMPTLVIHGDHDDITKDHQKSLAEKWKARIVSIQNSGHVPFWEQPETFNRTLDAYLKEINWTPPMNSAVD